MINAFAESGNGFNLVVPVKRRQALVATNLLRNSRPELIADDGQGVYIPARPIAWPGPDRIAGLWPRFTRSDDISDR